MTGPVPESTQKEPYTILYIKRTFYIELLGFFSLLIIYTKIKQKTKITTVATHDFHLPFVWKNILYIYIYIYLYIYIYIYVNIYVYIYRIYAMYNILIYTVC